MHKLNVLILGSNSFITTLNELKPFLKFNPLVEKFNSNYDVILFHEEALKDKINTEIINKSKILKVCAISAKKIFSNNSSLEIKTYILNKNEKKLTKENNQVFLTEKEIQLLELFLENSKPISKNKILSNVWNYSSSADTHTVETHIYRLRKKISDKFSDDSFILNTKDGYSL